MSSLELKVPPVVLAAIAALAMWGAAAVWPGAGFPVPGKNVLSALFVALGAAVALAGVAAFHAHRTTVNPTRPSAASSVVRDGVYRHTRNPMYLGLALGLAGWGVHLANAASLALLPAFVAYLNRFQIEPEERALRARFGQEFADYMAAVRRWV
jgi:protein-S-isoprenylcysteine O-methyltransferase Ste14